MDITEKFKALLKLKEAMQKNKKLTAVVILGLAVMLLLLFSEAPGRQQETVPQQETAETAQQLSDELSALLMNINGAGRVKVMITYESSNEQVYACDTDENTEQKQDEISERSYKSEHIIIKDDSGEAGLIIKENYSKVRGVAVVCDGANDPYIKGQIISTVSALFDINSTRISVAEMAA